ncbi:T9SS type A sorting domain-containing protein [Corallibacter sp.]|uniref:T9SS type A sorting domain-containing protein n=1 Tax=Corallibacter sp. TaxID=2038084 RepID=UPI003AB76F2C
MKTKLFFYALMLPLFIYSQEFTTYREDVFDPDGIEGDYFGNKFAVSPDGNTIVVTSPRYDGVTGTDANIGKASVYQYSNNSWEKIGNDIVGLQAGDYFGDAVDINATGDIIVVGAPSGSPNGNTYSGYVRVFQNVSGTWTQLGSDFIGGSTGVSLGRSISLNADGTRLAVGIPGANTGTGEVKVYEYNSGNWLQLGSTLEGLVTGENFGSTLDFNNDGDYLAVGAPYHNINGTTSGQSRGQISVYQYSSDWNRVFNAEGSQANDRLGNTIALSGNRGILAAGTRLGTGVPGYVKTYYSNGVSYTYFRDIFGLSNGDRFGSSLSLNNDGLFMAIGARFFNSSSSPRVYLYKRGQIEGVNHWVIQSGEYDDSVDAGSGQSVALNSEGNVLFTSSDAQNPNGITGVIKTYADHSTLTVENNVLQNQLAIYPNPATHSLFIKSVSHSKINSVRVFDITGRLCVDKQINTLKEVRIDMNHLSKGSYLVKVQVENATKTFKVLKN